MPFYVVKRADNKTGVDTPIGILEATSHLPAMRAMVTADRAGLYVIEKTNYPTADAAKSAYPGIEIGTTAEIATRGK